VPNIAPRKVRLDTVNFLHWYPVTFVQEIGPQFVRDTIFLERRVFIKYDMYDWSQNSFTWYHKNLYNRKEQRESGGVTFTRYAPVVVDIDGTIMSDKTNYSSTEQPVLVDFDVTGNMQYYVDGQRIVTNVDLNDIGVSQSGMSVTYSVLVDRARVEAILRSNDPASCECGPQIDFLDIKVASQTIQPSFS
jgi:hypothetical protein